MMTCALDGSQSTPKDVPTVSVHKVDDISMEIISCVK